MLPKKMLEIRQLFTGKSSMNCNEIPVKPHRRSTETIYGKKKCGKRSSCKWSNKIPAKTWKSHEMSSENVKMWKSNEIPTNFPRSTLAKIQFYPKSLQINFGWILLDIYIYIYIIIYNIYIYTPNIYTKFRWNSKLVDISLVVGSWQANRCFR